MPVYEKGSVRIHYEESGSGIPLLLIPGGGLNSTIASLATPFNPFDEFKGEYRLIASDLRNSNGGQSGWFSLKPLQWRSRWRKPPAVRPRKRWPGCTLRTCCS